MAQNLRRSLSIAMPSEVLYFPLICLVDDRQFRSDPRVVKVMVTFVWLLDALHSCFILTSLFYYLIKFFGMHDYINHIPWPLALFLAFFRIVAAAISTGEMLRLRRFSAFTERYPGWIFTLGLALSSVVDVMITSWLCYFLRTLKENIPGDSTLMMRMVDVLTLYTLENGLLPCIVAMASLICWFAMPRNLIFLGLHLVIGKLYANSLLASLNARQEFRQIQIDMRTRNQHPWRMPGYIGYRPGPLYTIKEVTTEEYVEDRTDSNSDHEMGEPALPPVTFSNQRHEASAAFLHLAAVAPHASAR
ncbi:hypothetical protein CVT24_008162 [Panaeolus cyanescens]|uniref:DUF6534 domain-containing protein n=1 Tax=Panaeolus cyanescens TaxID=181874 RepID=A0A409VFF1_9AGAR|nr:hypothetical protein CVT24_008162 [Panaeolus cyanescens]